MARSKTSRPSSVANRTKVHIARPAGRPFQLRYRCPIRDKQVRISISTRNEREAQRMKAELEAKFLLGLSPHTTTQIVGGPDMSWVEFREQYRTTHLATLRSTSAEDAEVRLDIATKLLTPQSLGEMAEPSLLHQLQARLLAGEGSLRNRPRSPHTVRGYMGGVLASLRWAHLQGWLPEEPKIRKLKVAKRRAMKGRPLTDGEYKCFLEAIPKVVGEEAFPSWDYLVRSLYESALRISELMHVSWDLPNTIRPVWPNGGHPLLEIPSALQKNDMEESIPLLPGLEALLLKIPDAERTGWIFQPASLQVRLGRNPKKSRPTTKWVGKVLSRIGEQANVVVRPADEATERPAKYASAHDLRRSCAQRLRDAGVPPLVICRVMRHSSWETTQKHYAPGDVQNDAKVLWSTLRRDET